jgi:hypothetical protein
MFVQPSHPAHRATSCSRVDEAAATSAISKGIPLQTHLPDSSAAPAALDRPWRVKPWSLALH